MKHTEKLKKMMMVAGGLLAAASCSDYDDFNTVPTMDDPVAEKTLWENISENPELTDFAAVLQRLGYDEVLDASHTYTVWAPVNGSFDMDSLSNVSDEKVEKEFLRNMIADYAHRETDISDTVVYMLNKKLMKFSGKGSGRLTFDGQPLLLNSTNQQVYNYPCVNGLLYTAAAPSLFRYNGYEYFSEVAGVADSLMDYVKWYELISLDENASVKGEIRDGVQHYDDSVIVVSNTLTRRRLGALLESEDSLYTVLIPTNNAWNTAYGRISAYYKYIPELTYQDLSNTALENVKGGTGVSYKETLGATTLSLSAPPVNAPIQETAAYWTDSITKSWIVNDLFFSENFTKYNGKLATGASFTDKDTLISTTYTALTNLPYLESVTEKVVKLSNGHARIINEYPFLPEETYAPVIKSRNVGRVLTASGYSYTNMYMVGTPHPSICVLDDPNERFEYIRTELPDNSNQAPELDFYLNNVLSTTYDVYAVIVPSWLDSTPGEEGYKPYTLYFDINYTDADNKQVEGRFDGETIQIGKTKMKKVEPFIVEQGEKVDTLKLGRVTFPVCYANTGARPNIKVMHSVSSFLSSYKKKYEQELRVANIILRPVENEE